jgi:hypothetical protein
MFVFNLRAVRLSRRASTLVSNLEILLAPTLPPDGFRISNRSGREILTNAVYQTIAMELVGHRGSVRSYSLKFGSDYQSRERG